MVWSLNNARFSVKDAYRHLCEPHSNVLDWDLIWKIKVPSRIKVFLWKIAKNILPTKSLIFTRTRIGNGLCMACNIAIEDVEHVFWKCSKVQEVWREFFAW